MSQKRSPKSIMSVALLTVGVCASAQPPDTTKPRLLHALFADHAVLQRERPIDVWGTAAPNDRVTVTLGSADVTAQADGQGRFKATLKAMPPGGPYELLAQARSGASLRISDVQIGDVWLCSGQSNMA